MIERFADKETYIPSLDATPAGAKDDRRRWSNNARVLREVVFRVLGDLLSVS